MNIDRNNYEMYFLLYTDNELSAAERMAVEEFVAENADLKNELNLLLSTTLAADELVFTSKNELYKKEATPDLLEEKMLLHLDDELEPSAIMGLKKAIDEDERLKRAWTILQQTKLSPAEKIIFEDKQSLYRYEKDKVVLMRFWRAAVAAAIIGGGIFIGITLFKKNDQPANVVVKDKKEAPTQKNNLQKSITVPSINKDAQTFPAENLAKQETNSMDVPVKENQVSDKIKIKNMVAVSPENKNKLPAKEMIYTPAENKSIAQKGTTEKQSNHLPKPYFENINNSKSNQTVSSSVQDNMKTLQQKNQEEKINPTDIAVSKVKEQIDPAEEIALTQTRNSYAKNTMLDASASETGENHILFINEEKINRSKVSGLFKRVKRVLSRNANINTGSSLKIAGFEIATR